MVAPMKLRELQNIRDWFRSSPSRGFDQVLERRKQDLAVRKTHDQDGFRELLKSSTVGLIRIDADWMITHYNTACANMLGLDRDRLLFAHLPCIPELEVIYELLKETIDQKEKVRQDVCHMTRGEGLDRRLECRMELLQGGRKAFNGVIIQVSDATRPEQPARESRPPGSDHPAERASHEHLHDLSNQLCVIANMAELIESDEGCPAEMKEKMVRPIRACVERARGSLAAMKAKAPSPAPGVSRDPLDVLAGVRDALLPRGPTVRRVPDNPASWCLFDPDHAMSLEAVMGSTSLSLHVDGDAENLLLAAQLGGIEVVIVPAWARGGRQVLERFAMEAPDVKRVLVGPAPDDWALLADVRVGSGPKAC